METANLFRESGADDSKRVVGRTGRVGVAWVRRECKNVNTTHACKYTHVFMVCFYYRPSTRLLHGIENSK